MLAALDRCRSYRSTDAPKCELVDVDGSAPDTRANNPEQLARIYFLGAGLDGSHFAAMSFAPGSSQGHLWLVDQKQERDCKGEWQRQESGFTWNIRCPDGLVASGSLSDPTNGSGTGKGTDHMGKHTSLRFKAD